VSALAPFTLEVGLGALLLIVFVAGLVSTGEDRRAIAWVATAGVLVLSLVAMLLAPTGSALGGMFVQDGLAIFAKRLFLTATFIGLLAGLSLPERGGRPSTTCSCSARCSACCCWPRRAMSSCSFWPSS
jgi:NADH:ubiquinone oxidoreductase subunit 2 (subunit N)